MHSPTDHWSEALSPRGQIQIVDAAYAFFDKKIAELGEEKAYELGRSFGFIFEISDDFAGSCGLQNRPERRFQIYIQSEPGDTSLQLHFSPIMPRP